MDIGAVLVDDKTSYFIFCRQERWPLYVKRTVQCSDEFYHKIALELIRKKPCRPKFVIETQKTQFHRPIIPFLAPVDEKLPHGRPK